MAKLSYLYSLFFISLLPFSPGAVMGTRFTIVNNCDQPVWPGIISNAGMPQLSTTGFAIQKGETKTITPPSSWGGRFWGRTLCATDKSTGKFTCQTGDCGSGKMECAGGGAAPPATLAEFTLDGSGGQDFYDVSLVDGYNLPMLVVPRGGTGENCTSTGCVTDLNGQCPSTLRVTSADGGGQSVACNSACDAFNQPQYCCSGVYGSPDTCKPSAYSLAFKKACPTAYSYAYDDKTSTFICRGSVVYTIIFCPSHSTSQKQEASSSSSSEGQGTPDGSSSPSPPLSSSSMVYVGALDRTNSESPSSTPYTWTHVIRAVKDKRKFPVSVGFLLITAQWWLWWVLLAHHYC